MPKNVIEVVIEGTDKLSAPLSRIDSALGGVLTRLGVVAGAVTTAATSVAAFTIKMASMEEQVFVAAQKLGVTTSELSKWQKVADYANVPTETFNSSLKFLARNASDAARGVGESAKTFTQLGIDAKQFLSLSMDQRMETLSRAFSNLGTQEERISAAMQLFGRGGADMVLMLDGNTEAMTKLAERTEYLGGVISDEAGKNAEKFGDQLGELKTAIGGVSRGIADQLIPEMGSLFQGVAELIANNREAIVSFVGDAIYGIKTLFVFLINDSIIVYNAIVGSFRATWEMFVTLGQWAWDTVKGIFTGNRTDSLFSAIARGLANARKAADDNITAINDALKAEEDQLNRVKKATAEAGAASSSTASKTANEVVTSGEAIKNVYKNSSDGCLEFNEKLLETRNIYRSVTEGCLDFNTALRGVEVTQGSVFENLKSMWEQFRTWQGDITEQMARSLYDTMQEAVTGISQGVAQAIVSGGSLAKVFNAVIRQVAEQIIAMYIEIGIQRLVLNKIFGATLLKNTVSEITAGVYKAGVNAYASTAAIPIIGPALAPGAAALAITNATAIGAPGIAAAVAGAAHGGLTNVPAESTFLLQAGERVVSPRQNEDLTDFLASAETGGITIQQLTVNVLPNATSADFLLRMSPAELEDKLGKPVIRALNGLNRKGQRPIGVGRVGS